MLSLHMYACGCPLVCVLLRSGSQERPVLTSAFGGMSRWCRFLLDMHVQSLLVRVFCLQSGAPAPAWVQHSIHGVQSNRDPGKMYRCRCSHYAHCSVCIVKLCMCTGLDSVLDAMSHARSQVSTCATLIVTPWTD
jgi:hypothetical protein